MSHQKHQLQLSTQRWWWHLESLGNSVTRSVTWMWRSNPCNKRILSELNPLSYLSSHESCSSSPGRLIKHCGILSFDGSNIYVNIHICLFIYLFIFDPSRLGYMKFIFSYDCSFVSSIEALQGNVSLFLMSHIHISAKQADESTGTWRWTILN